MSSVWASGQQFFVILISTDKEEQGIYVTKKKEVQHQYFIFAKEGQLQLQNILSIYLHFDYLDQH